METTNIKNLMPNRQFSAVWIAVILMASAAPAAAASPPGAPTIRGATATANLQAIVSFTPTPPQQQRRRGHSGLYRDLQLRLPHRQRQ